MTCFFLEIFFVNGGFSEIGFDVVELAQVPATVAFRTETTFSTVIHEIDLSEFGHGLIEGSAGGLLVFGDDLIASG